MTIGGTDNAADAADPGAMTSGIEDPQTYTENGTEPRRRSDTLNQQDQKLCLVISPFGTKPNPTNEHETIDFEEIYNELIEPAVKSLVRVQKMNRIDSTSLIHTEMLAKIIRADLVIADISTHNPNVFYELGVRHAAQRSGTIVISQHQAPPPFDIGAVRVHPYQFSGIKEEPRRSEQLEKDRRTLEAAVRAALERRATDSPVHQFTPRLTVVTQSQPLEDLRKALKDISVSEKLEDAKSSTSGPAFTEETRRNRHLGIFTGDLTYAMRIADVWVNPENHRFQMSPLYDSTVSAFVRVLGAYLDQHGEIAQDQIADELRACVTGEVQPGSAAITCSGRLWETHGVRAIIHVAAQVGEPLGGFYTMSNYQRCVWNALELLDRINKNIINENARNRGWWRKRGEATYCDRFGETPLTSVLFPLFGTRSRDRDPNDVAFNIIREAKRYLDSPHDTSITRVYFLATSDVDLDLCETAFSRLGLQIKPEDWQYVSRGKAVDV